MLSLTNVVTSPTASTKLSATCLPASTAAIATSDKSFLVSFIAAFSSLIVVGSLSPKNDCSQASCASCKPNLIPKNANFKGVIAIVNKPPTTFFNASKPPVASLTFSTTSTIVSTKLLNTKATVSNAAENKSATF